MASNPANNNEEKVENPVDKVDKVEKVEKTDAMGLNVFRYVKYKITYNQTKSISLDVPYPNINPSVVNIMESLSSITREKNFLEFDGTYYGSLGWLFTRIGGVEAQKEYAYWQLIVDGEASNYGPSHHQINTGIGKSIEWKYTKFNVKKDCRSDVDFSHFLHTDHPCRKTNESS